MKYILLLVLIVHSMIHLLGFVKEFKLAQVDQLSGATLISLSNTAKKAAGAFWLVATILLTIATALWWKDTDIWWIIGGIGLVISQLLIILYWKDARFGTIANIIMLALVWVGYAQYQFNQKVNKEVQAIFTNGSTHNIVTEETIKELPRVVQHWMKQSGVIGKEITYSARLTQSGALRPSKTQDWMPVLATQYFNTETPAFVWRVKATMKGSIPISGRDMYADGKGYMLIKPLALFSVVNADGPKIDQGAMLRFLSEMCWMPSATLQPYYSWEGIDDSSAKLTMTYSGMTTAAVFTFDKQGRIKSIHAKRYKDIDDEQLTDWYIPISEWGTFEGITIPTKGDVVWKLEDGDFIYDQWQIDDISYNVATPY